MSVSITHTTAATTPDSNDGKISSNAWNEAHTITGLGTAALSDASAFQLASANLTAYAGAGWAAGVQIPALTAANTVTLKTVGTSAGNILDKASGDTLYQPVGSYLTGNQSITVSGDASGSGATAIALTLATVNANVGSFGSSSAVPVVTVNAKGLVTAVSTAALGTAAAQNSTAFLNTANNLSDIATLNTAIRNLQTGYVLGQSAVQVSHTGDTTETTLATILVPGGSVGANGQIVIDYDFTLTGTSAKTLRFKLGGTTLFTSSRTTPTLDKGTIVIRNRNGTASQRASLLAVTSSAAAAASVTTATVDTTADQNITITGQLALGTESFTLEAYQVLLYPKA
jgi:hypothetical protein